MASRTIHVNKVTGARYVYSVESYWDKEKPIVMVCSTQKQPLCNDKSWRHSTF